MCIPGWCNLTVATIPVFYTVVLPPADDGHALGQCEGDQGSPGQQNRTVCEIGVYRIPGRPKMAAAGGVSIHQCHAGGPQGDGQGHHDQGLQ